MGDIDLRVPGTPLSRLPIAGGTRPPLGLAEGGDPGRAATEFEALFIQQLLRGLRTTIPSSGLFGRSRDREIYESLMDQEVARALANRGGIGLKDVILAHLDRREALVSSTLKFGDRPAEREGEPSMKFTPSGGTR
ncbi:MAG: rod-binding protein [Deltaproteobacteria bacterium]|nr:rod-binding protein [Deltaproteobacteria bacterium]